MSSGGLDEGAGVAVETSRSAELSRWRSLAGFSSNMVGQVSDTWGSNMGKARTGPVPRSRESGVLTRAALVEAAAELFADRGYIQTSIRDIARSVSMTSGAVYGQFRNKSELLAEAISLRVRSGLAPAYGSPADRRLQHVDIMRLLALRIDERRQVRSLLLQGAAAALTDEETAQRLRDEQISLLAELVGAYEQHRDEMGINPSVDLYHVVMFTWASELGLGVLEAVGVHPRSSEDWAATAALFAQALTAPDD